jgi:magnesium and cobalt transporter
VTGLRESGGSPRTARRIDESSIIARVVRWATGLFGARNGESRLREAIEGIIEEIEEKKSEVDAAVPIGDDERVMLTNILNLRHLTAYDVMVPRADIVSVEFNIGADALLEAMRVAGHSRLPVFRGTLDEVVGMVHIKDVVDLARGDEPFDLANILRRVLMVSPSMRVIDLLLEMRSSRIHMALVVDEYGGVDGLVTIEDLVEEIVGEIEDEHDVMQEPELRRRSDGTIVADARVAIEEFEEMVGPTLSDEERDEDIDTLGGLIFTLLGRVPGRGELITHEASGITFEILEADPRRIKKLRIRDLPGRSAARSTHG